MNFNEIEYWCIISFSFQKSYVAESIPSVKPSMNHNKLIAALKRSEDITFIISPGRFPLDGRQMEQQSLMKHNYAQSLTDIHG